MLIEHKNNTDDTFSKIYGELFSYKKLEKKIKQQKKSKKLKENEPFDVFQLPHHGSINNIFLLYEEYNNDNDCDKVRKTPIISFQKLHSEKSDQFMIDLANLMSYKNSNIFKKILFLK